MYLHTRCSLSFQHGNSIHNLRLDDAFTGRWQRCISSELCKRQVHRTYIFTTLLDMEVKSQDGLLVFCSPKRFCCMRVATIDLGEERTLMRWKSSLLILLIGWLVLACTACSLPSTLSSGSLRPFSQDGRDYDYTSWSPDGHWLAAPMDDGSQDQIRLYAPDGHVLGTWRSVCGVGAFNTTIAWLPDGRISCDYSPDVWIATLNRQGQEISHEMVPLPTQPGTQVGALQWSLHHDWLATIAEAEPGSLNWLLYLSDIKGHLLLPPMPTDAGNIAWSPDGNTLAVVRTNEISLLTFQQTPTGDLVVKSERELPVEAPLEETITWSPSGHWLVVRHRTYEGEDYLFLLATDGSGKQVKLTSSYQNGQVFNPSWSPDGKQLIVTQVGSWVLLSLDMVAFFQQHKLTM